MALLAYDEAIGRQRAVAAFKAAAASRFEWVDVDGDDLAGSAPAAPVPEAEARAEAGRPSSDETQSQAAAKASCDEAFIRSPQLAALAALQKSSVKLVRLTHW